MQEGLLLWDRTRCHLVYLKFDWFPVQPSTGTGNPTRTRTRNRGILRSLIDAKIVRSRDAQCNNKELPNVMVPLKSGEFQVMKLLCYFAEVCIESNARLIAWFMITLAMAKFKSCQLEIGNKQTNKQQVYFSRLSPAFLPTWGFVDLGVILFALLLYTNF